jgi:hypothetical protein
VWSEWAKERGEGRGESGERRHSRLPLVGGSVTRGVPLDGSQGCAAEAGGSVVPGEEAFDLICRLLFDCSMIR